MKIGNLRLKGKTILAPLAGITNLPFRLIVKECGCALVCSEMISSRGILNNCHKTLMMFDSRKQERPLSVQIFGSDPNIMAQAAKIIEQEKTADIIDINFGCSVKKVVKTGAGVALMRNHKNAENVIKAVRKAISIPLTIKIRTGWDRSGIQAFEIAKIAEDNGVNAICVHPRTATQGFKGKPDLSLIKKIKLQISLPVIGNGDILYPEHALDMIKQTNCDGVMIGRGAISNPFIFSSIESLLKNEKCFYPDSNDIFKIMKKLLIVSIEYFGENKGCKIMRKRLSWFVKGLPNAANFRRSLSKIESLSDTMALINNFQESIEKIS
ncbi:MAG: tRNA dihydrouridine synthase DusB [Desulfobacteraceae bacterium 4572_130]|nr:MAG: tRNA dihydrouridine synthase DusB [Desulfobacteraceae bacterium 4572_130]